MPALSQSLSIARASTATLRGALLVGAVAFCFAAPHARAAIHTAAVRAEAPAMGGPTVTEQARAGAYRLALSIGPVEAMYTRAEYRKKHPRHGEIILGGASNMGAMRGGGMGMPPPHHLEVHVYNARTGAVVTDARVGIAVTDLHTGHTVVVPVMTMEGIGEGARDFHYGNTVMLTTGRYRVGVAVNGARASFVVNWREPSGMSSGM